MGDIKQEGKGVNGSMLLHEKFVLGVVKEVGNQDVVLVVGDEEIIIELTDGEAEELQQYLIDQENLLIPINIGTREMYLNDGISEWTETDLEELVNASKSYEEEEDDDNEK